MQIVRRIGGGIIVALFLIGVRFPIWKGWVQCRFLGDSQSLGVALSMGVGRREEEIDWQCCRGDC